MFANSPGTAVQMAKSYRAEQFKTATAHHSTEDGTSSRGRSATRAALAGAVAVTVMVAAALLTGATPTDIGSRPPPTDQFNGGHHQIHG